MARFLKIGREPCDVEIPAIGEAEILEAEQADLLRSDEFQPGYSAVRGRQVLMLFDQPQLRRVDVLIIAGIIPVPAVEEKGPDQANRAEQLESVPPGHESQHQRHQRWSE